MEEALGVVPQAEEAHLVVGKRIKHPLSQGCFWFMGKRHLTNHYKVDISVVTRLRQVRIKTTMIQSVTKQVVRMGTAMIAGIFQATHGFMTKIQVGVNPLIPVVGVPQPRFRQKIMRAKQRARTLNH